MTGSLKQSFSVPFQDPISDKSGKLSSSWDWFLRSVFERLYPLGQERSFDIVNNQAGVADVTDAVFDKRGISVAHFDYFIQRVTTGGSAIQKIEAGLLIFVYKPTSDAWAKVTIGTPGPDASGVTFSITASGQVQYTSSNETGTASISKLYWRARTMAGKHHTYSKAGLR